MKTHRARFMRTAAGVIAAAILWVPAANADFVAGFRNYQKGNFAEARTQFLDLAELGDGASQFNLGAMALRGEGVPKDVGMGLGWIRSAAQNGYTGMSEEKISALEAKLTPEQQQAAAAVISNYGIEALRKRTLPMERFNCIQRVTRPVTVAIATPRYPLGQAQNRQDGAVIMEVRVGVDGLASDPQVISAVPPRVFDNSALAAVLRSRFKPATLGGSPIAGRRAVRISYFMKKGGVLWNVDSIKKLREAADSGEPQARFLMGVYASLDDSLKIPRPEAQQMLLSSAQSGHPGAQFWIARELQQNTLCTGTDKAQPWLERAANSKLAPAMAVHIRYLLDKSPDSAQLEQIGRMIRELVAADDAYSLKHATALLSLPPVPALGDPALALQAAKSLAKLDSPDPQALEAIAAAYAANGDFKHAAEQQDEALGAAQDLYWNTTLIEERLTAYEAGKAWQGDLFALPPTTETVPDVDFPLKRCDPGKKKRCGRAPDHKSTPTGSYISR